MAKKLFVGNLPEGCSNTDLRKLFETVGEVTECDVLKNYGFVHMASETECQEAVTQLDKTDFMGNFVQVQFSTSSVHKETGVGSNGACFQCGKLGHLSRDCHMSMNGRGDFGRGRGRGFRGRGGWSRGGERGRGLDRGRGRGRGGDRGRGRGRGRGDYGSRDYGGRPSSGARDYGGAAEFRDRYRERDYVDYAARRPPPPDPYYDRYDRYEDSYSRRPPPYPYSSRDYLYPSSYRARSRSPPPLRRPLTPPRYRRRGDSPPPPPRSYYDYPPSDRYGEARSRYPPPPPRARFSPPPIRQSAF